MHEFPIQYKPPSVLPFFVLQACSNTPSELRAHGPCTFAFHLFHELRYLCPHIFKL